MVFEVQEIDETGALTATYLAFNAGTRIDVVVRYSEADGAYEMCHTSLLDLMASGATEAGTK